MFSQGFSREGGGVRGEGRHRFPFELGRPSKAVAALFPASHRTPKARGKSGASGATRNCRQSYDNNLDCESLQRGQMVPFTRRRRPG